MTPCDNILNAISSFLILKNITNARSWFGLVNQVAWAYSLSLIMLLFWDLVKKNTHFVWNESLEKAFQQSKQIIVSLVKKGSYHLRHQQGSQPSPRLEQGRHGLPIIAEVLHVPTKKAPVRCSDGWHIVFTGSRFCTDAERRYAPIEGEAGAIAQALEKC